jgi:hypothetical protein
MLMQNRSTYDRTEEAARASLLAYYSDKSTAHAVFLLTVGIIAVSLVALPIQRYLLIALLSVSAGASAYVVYRMLYWGKLSQRVLHVPPHEEGGRPLMFALHEGAVIRLEEESWAWRASRGNGILLGFFAGIWVLIILGILSKYGLLFVESH